EDNHDHVLLQLEQLIKHPKQAHLHNPNQTKGLYFHERNPLSHFQKPYPKPSHLPEFNLQEINYHHSLQQPITHLQHQLKHHDSEHPPLSLKNL
ncbi:sporulation phosphorelay system protein KapB, partial [Staphylococcus capitis]|uniref:sporulation phosphorelay system protein KapB n=1 Tax=Staphylococcus capitis TaxID=29388 RepID=UPI00119F124F